MVFLAVYVVKVTVQSRYFYITQIRRGVIQHTWVSSIYLHKLNSRN